MIAGPAAAQVPFNPDPPDMTAAYGSGGVTPRDLMGFAYITNDALLGTRWREMSSFGISNCVSDTARYPDFGTGDQRLWACTAYTKGYLYPPAVYSAGSYSWDRADDGITRYDLAAWYDKWGYFYDVHNSTSGYYRVGEDAPGGGAELHDLPYNSGSGPNALSAFGDYYEDHYDEIKYPAMVANTFVERGMNKVVHPANRVMDPSGNAYPWQFNADGTASTPPNQFHMVFNGWGAVANGEAEVMMSRAYCAATSEKNLLPSTHYKLRGDCYADWWENTMQSPTRHRMLPDTQQPPASGFTLEYGSYWQGYGFDNVGTNDFGWFGNGAYSITGWPGGSGGAGS